MRGRSITTSTAEPFIAGKTLYHAARVMNTTVRTGMSRKLFFFLRVSLALSISVGRATDLAFQVIIFEDIGPIIFVIMSARSSAA
jgi:hypothetical protein